MKTKLCRPISNQNGSTIVIAVVAASLLLLGLRVAYDMSLNSTRMSRMNRVKTAMNGTAAKLRALAHSPESYSTCESTSSGQCLINSATINSLQTIVNGARCTKLQPGQVCGINISNPRLEFEDPANPSAMPDHFAADVIYTGEESPIAPIPIKFLVPKEVLQESDYNCPSSRPIFGGFNSDYTIICNPLPTDCLPDEFVTAVAPGDLKLTCKKIPNFLGCGDQLIKTFEWKNGTFSVTCMPRKNPYEYFGFAPDVDVK